MESFITLRPDFHKDEAVPDKQWTETGFCSSFHMHAADKE